ncbi:MAG: M28 family peptidase [Promethearchaeota archaeon]
MSRFKTAEGKYMYEVIERVSQYKRLSGTEGNEKGFNEILKMIKESDFNPEIQEFQCSDFPIKVAFRINGLILALLYTLTWISLLLRNGFLALSFSIIAFTYALLSEKIASYSLGRFKNIGKKIKCHNIYWSITPKERPKYHLIMCGHIDSKSQTFPVKLRAFLMIAMTITMLIFSIRALLFSIYLLIGSFLWIKDVVIPSIYSMIWTYFITLSILFNGYGNKSPGANDNLTGTACVIQLARYFQKNPLKNTELVFLLTDAEEMGLYGAQAFIDEKNKDFHPKNTFFIVYDTIGDKPLLNLKSFGIPPKIVSKRFQKIVALAKEKNMLPKLKSMYLPIGAATDHVIFKRYGYDVLIIASLCKKVHTKNDTIDYIYEEPLIQALEAGKAIAELIDSEICSEN